MTRERGSCCSSEGEKRGGDAEDDSNDEIELPGDTLDTVDTSSEINRNLLNYVCIHKKNGYN